MYKRNTLLFVIGIGLIAVILLEVYHHFLLWPKDEEKRVVIYNEAYQKLNQSNFDGADFDCGKREMIFKEFRWSKTVKSTFELVETMRIPMDDVLTELSEYIKSAMVVKNGIVFIYAYTWETDVYGYYVSNQPDVEWLAEFESRKINDTTYWVMIPYHIYSGELYTDLYI